MSMEQHLANVLILGETDLTEAAQKRTNEFEVSFSDIATTRVPNRALHQAHIVILKGKQTIVLKNRFGNAGALAGWSQEGTSEDGRKYVRCLSFTPVRGKQCKRAAAKGSHFCSTHSKNA